MAGVSPTDRPFSCAASSACQGNEYVTCDDGDAEAPGHEGGRVSCYGELHSRPENFMKLLFKTLALLRRRCEVDCHTRFGSRRSHVATSGKS